MFPRKTVQIYEHNIMIQPEDNFVLITTFDVIENLGAPTKKKLK